MNINKKLFYMKPIDWVNFIVLLVFTINIFIIVINGKDSIIAIHDNLDYSVPVFKMLKDNNLLFAINEKTPTLGNMSSLYFQTAFFDFQTIMYFIFDVFDAYVIIWITSLFIAFFSMKMLLEYIFPNQDSAIIKLVSLAFSILPVNPLLNIGFASIPFIILIFLKAFNSSNTNFNVNYILLIFYPIFSRFAFQGIFILGLWFIGILYYTIKYKKINKNLIVGFILLIVGYIIVDLKLFYMMFIAQEPLNREIFNTPSSNFFIRLKNVFIYGQYHAESFQSDLIVPTVIIGLIILNIKYFKTRVYPLISKIALKRCFDNCRIDPKQTEILNKIFGIILFFSIIDACYAAKVFKEIFADIMPLLNGFNWGRIFFFNRVLWYIAFCIVLFEFAKKEKYKYCAYFLAIIQICLVFITPGIYNDTIKNVFYHTIGNKQSIFYSDFLLNKDNKKFQEDITYKEFFSEELFSKIKQDISYNNEPVVAFGYHPSVLMYNGFNNIDGYNNCYPLSYFKQFRKIIEPELEINPIARSYFDNWGARLYIYGSGTNYFHTPTRIKISQPIPLNIDMNTFSQMGGKYILSRVPVKNSRELSLELLNVYENNSIYKIYVYKSI